MPEIGARDVLIKVMACGVCGTDVHIFEGDQGAADCTPPTILGHEFSGIVEQAGGAVANLKPGDRVCVDPNGLCGSCDFCRNGTGHFCENMTGVGTTADGGFAQYCRVHQKQVYHIADTTSFEEGAMAEPVACCLHGIDLCDIKPGSTVLVIGGGMIGLIMLQLARIAGAARIALIEPVESKRAMGKKLGADLCIDPLTQDAPEVLSAEGFGQMDGVIECVGLPQTIRQAVALAGKGSVVMMFGLTKPDDEVSIKPFEIFKKEITLRSSYINPYTISRALALIDNRRIDVSSMIYGCLPLEGLAGVLSSPTLRQNGKYIVNPWKE